MANKLTLTEIENIIDIHIEEDRNFLMVVNKDLAMYICGYLADEYDISDEDDDLDNEEFYVSMWFDDGKLKFYCESAEGKDHYKFVETYDNNFVDYFIFSDTKMNGEDVNNYLTGSATWSWVELVNDEEKENYCQCCACEVEDCKDFNCTCNIEESDEVTNGNVDEYLEIPCQCETCCEARGEYDEEDIPCFCEHCNESREQELIDQCMEVVFNGCPNCAIEAIIDLAFNFKEIGILQAKQDMKDFLED